MHVEGEKATRVRDFPLKLDVTTLSEKQDETRGGEKGSHHGNTEGQKSIERRQKHHTIQAGDTDAFIVDQWCDCRPEVLQDGHRTGLTLNDHVTNVTNKPTHTPDKELRLFAPAALPSAWRTYQKLTRAHLCTHTRERVLWIELFGAISQMLPVRLKPVFFC